MQNLDMYADFEPLIPFDREIEFLHKTYLDKLLDLGAKTILDVGCGSGDFLLLSKENAIACKGIDLSEKMVLNACKKGANAEKRDLNDESGFYDALTAIFDVVNYIAPSELANFFISAKNRLNRGGFFIFDINTLYGFQDVASGSISLEKDGLFGSVRSEFADQKLISDFDLFTKIGEVYKRDSWSIEQFYHSDREIENALKTAGFSSVKTENIKLYGTKPDKKLYITGF
ncbi:hypothetical protein FACS189487_03230 [Campylobacterota bacterium]|nr:hypothetical protein FACS189487_03230 [Campylobacterota bacterium]